LGFSTSLILVFHRHVLHTTEKKRLIIYIFMLANARVDVRAHGGGGYKERYRDVTGVGAAAVEVRKVAGLIPNGGYWDFSLT